AAPRLRLYVIASGFAVGLGLLGKLGAALAGVTRAALPRRLGEVVSSRGLLLGLGVHGRGRGAQARFAADLRVLAVGRCPPSASACAFTFGWPAVAVADPP